MQRGFGSGKFRSCHGHFHQHLYSIQNIQQCFSEVHLSLLVSQRQNGRRQHLKSFRQNLITCAVLWDSLPKHCMNNKKLGGFQAGRNWGNQLISAESSIQSQSLCAENNMQPGSSRPEHAGVESSYKEVLHNVLLLPSCRHCYKSG